MLRGLALVLAVAALAGCGGTAHKAAAPPAAKPCVSPKAKKAIVRIERDIAAIHAAAAANKAAVVSHDTDVFMNDVFTAPISGLQQNRYIDRAAAALQGVCPDCFQALEANRPIVTIAHENHKGNCSK